MQRPSSRRRARRPASERACSAAPGLVALYGVGALIAAAVLGIGTFLEPWIGAVIVGVVLLAIAGILALTGKKKVEQATPPLPEGAMESTKRDVDEVKRARARA